MGALWYSESLSLEPAEAGNPSSSLSQGQYYLFYKDVGRIRKNI